MNENKMLNSDCTSDLNQGNDHFIDLPADLETPPPDSAVRMMVEMREVSSEFMPDENPFGYVSATNPNHLNVNPSGALANGWITNEIEGEKLVRLIKHICTNEMRRSSDAGLCEFFGAYLVGYEDECFIVWVEGGQPEFDQAPCHCDYECTLAWIHRSILGESDVESAVMGKVVRRLHVGTRKEVLAEVEVPEDEERSQRMAVLGNIQADANAAGATLDCAELF